MVIGTIVPLSNKRKSNGMWVDQDCSIPSASVEDQAATASTAGGPVYGPDEHSRPSKPLSIMPAPSDDYNAYGHPCDQDGHPYVGLVNQAMTCYLNSLIQALFMTPEFRNILYEWQYGGTAEETTRSIPFQLQKLFALLQTSKKNALETKDLTASFGWEGSDAYEQHDVQELSRVMLEALEHRFRKSEQHRTFIQNLYKGKMEDVIKCHGCHQEKVREDIFNDLALAIREWGATESYKSVEEALHAFTKPELLTGANKYKCGNCNAYHEAEKGLRITDFPYLLAIQLKRFTVDYTSGYRVKLNDVMTFPDYLDLNRFRHDPEKTTKPVKLSYAAAAAAAKKKPETIEENSVLNVKKPGDQDGWINKPPCCDEVQQMLKNGKYVYELFAIMIHQGSATGGHYFAYVKNLEDSTWLCFNDTTVKAVDIDEVKRSFGGVGWSSNTNAYLMMYRQIDPDRNQKFTRTLDLPSHVIKLLKQWEDEEIRQANERKRIDSMVKVKVLLNDERILMEDSPYGAIENMFYREDTVQDITDYFATRFTEMGIFADPKNALLYKTTGCFAFGDTTPVDKTKTVDELVSCIVFFSELTFIMELTPEASSGDTDITRMETTGSGVLRTLDFYTVDISFDTVRMCKRLWAYESHTIGSIRKRISAILPKSTPDGTACRIVVDWAIDDGLPYALLEDDDQLLSDIYKVHFQIARFYVDCGVADALKADRELPTFEHTRMKRIIDKRKYGMRLKIHLPSAADYQKAGLSPPTAAASKKAVLAAVSTDENVHSPPVSPLSKRFCKLGPFGDGSASQATSSTTTSFGDTGMMQRFVMDQHNCPQMPLPSYDEVVGPRVSPIEGAGALPSYGDTMVSSIDDDTAALLDNNSDMEVENPSEGCSPTVSDNEENLPPAFNDDAEHQEQPTFEEWKNHTNVSATAFTTTNPTTVLAGAGHSRYQGNALNTYGATNSFSTIDERQEKEAKEEIVSDAYTYPEHTVDIVDEGVNEALRCKYVVILIDVRQYVRVLVDWIAQHLNLSLDNVHLTKHYSEADQNGYEVNFSPDERIKQTFVSLNRLTVTLRVPTSQNEKLVKVFDFDFASDQAVDNWPLLFSVPATTNMLVSEFIAKCSALLENAYAEKYPPERLRLRDIANSGVPVFNPTAKLSIRLVTDVQYALQKLKPEDPLIYENGVMHQTLIVRRFCPSTLEIMAPFEILIPENEKEPGRVIKLKVAEHAKLAPERIGFSELLPSGSFSRWPFTQSPIHLMEMRFASDVVVPLSFGGKLLYYVDKNETRKTLTEDDRRQYRIRERISNNNAVRRIERPLRIQMSSISESDP